MKLANIVATAVTLSISICTSADDTNSVFEIDLDIVGPLTGSQKMAATGLQHLMTYRACCASNGYFVSEPNAALFGRRYALRIHSWEYVNTEANRPHGVTLGYGPYEYPRLQTVNAAKSMFEQATAVDTLTSLPLRAIESLDLSNVANSYSDALVATGAQTRILFKDSNLNTARADGLIDNARVRDANVPLPGSLLLLFSGAAGLRLLSRKSAKLASSRY